MPSLSFSEIDKSNDSLWSMRYSDPGIVVSKAENLLETAQKSDYKKGIAYAKLNIAVASFLQSKNETALENLSDSLKWFSENPSESGHAKALYIKGNICESFGEYEKALEYCLLSEKLANQIKDLETEAEAASQLGLIYTRLHNFSKAHDYYKHGLNIREQLNDSNAVASSLNRLGMLMRLTKKYDDSLEYYFRSLDIRRKNNQDTSIPWTLLGIASTYEDLGNNDEALRYFEQGPVGGDKRCTLQCMMGAGRIYSLMGENKKAEEKLEESLRIALDLKALSLVSEAHSALAKHYESIGNPVKALESYKLYQKTRESVYNEEAQSRLRNVEISHAVEKSEQEKEIFRLRHIELKEAFDIIDEKNRDITASINYASRIQKALLPDIREVKGFTANNIFILLLPKDIVSGDFYWFTRINEKIIISAVDCTGHGVPGALMSMLGVSFLEDIVNNREITDSALILDALSKEVRRALHQKGEIQDSKDGMDISLCVIDNKKKTIQYSGAHNNLYLIRDNDLIEYKADRLPIGYYDDAEKKFSKVEIDTSPGDIIYLFSDGYADQFGGSDNKKFKYSTLKELILKIHSLPFKDQKAKLEKEFYAWKGKNTQVDDVLIIGMRI